MIVRCANTDADVQAESVPMGNTCFCFMVVITVVVAPCSNQADVDRPVNSVKYV